MRILGPEIEVRRILRVGKISAKCVFQTDSEVRSEGAGNPLKTHVEPVTALRTFGLRPCRSSVSLANGRAGLQFPAASSCKTMSFVLTRAGQPLLAVRRASNSSVGTQ